MYNIQTQQSIVYVYKLIAMRGVQTVGNKFIIIKEASLYINHIRKAADDFFNSATSLYI